ncbi:MAG: glutathione S-transferase N-terminal domain-containing protein [Proteobacteria bacterium]|nr:glutathione S-transferase N-terminal domain-containing protein [Pseudomonadota bacterium]
MIDLYYAPTPNGSKLRMALEELALPYRLVRMALSEGEQFTPAFTAISPNQKMPALVDHAPADGGGPLAVFESGAMLMYLADKTGRLLPADPRGRLEAMQWLFWQMAGLGPMSGQAGHFRRYAPEGVPYAIERYTREVARLYGVLDARLAGREFIAGAYSIADIACYPWVAVHAGLGQDLTDRPHVKRWLDHIALRPATVRAYADVADPYAPAAAPLSSQARQHLFGGTAP